MIMGYPPLQKIYRNIFTLHIAPRVDLIDAYEDLLIRIPKTPFRYVQQTQGSPYLIVEPHLKNRVKYEIAETFEGLTSVLHEEVYSILMIQYSPVWFESLASIEMFVQLCRDRSRKYGSVVLMSMMKDTVLESIEQGVDKQVCYIPLQNGGSLLDIADFKSVESQKPSVRIGQQKLMF